ncbi:hypothetical protein BpHYR1_045322 [Brachionus plicatilis]|uniref:Uncharacterized protein n=1 Tax=Brachionus plicatilis TaxID=10195 RepID=A0A3M7QIJ1_BRAPC|nr:hypothetical protein BpHYR1_045322 [Brachionus plicatilis]
MCENFSLIHHLGDEILVIIYQICVNKFIALIVHGSYRNLCNFTVKKGHFGPTVLKVIKLKQDSFAHSN